KHENSNDHDAAHPTILSLTRGRRLAPARRQRHTPDARTWIPSITMIGRTTCCKENQRTVRSCTEEDAVRAPCVADIDVVAPKRRPARPALCGAPPLPPVVRHGYRHILRNVNGTRGFQANAKEGGHNAMCAGDFHGRGRRGLRCIHVERPTPDTP